MKEFCRYYFGGLYHRIDRHNVLLLAEGLAFSFLVCMVPFVLVLLSVLGNVWASSFEHQIDAAIARWMPYSPHAVALKAFLLARVQEIVVHKNTAGYVGALGMLLGASSLFGSMRIILNKILKIRVNEHIVINKLHDFGMVLLVLIFFLIAMLISPALELMTDFADRMPWLRFLRFNEILQVLFSVFSFLLAFLAAFAMYALVPAEKIERPATAVSALFAAVFWEIAKQLFSYYVTHGATLQKVYGAYIFIATVVLWVFYSALVFIIGAEIGQLYRERRRKLDSEIELDNSM